MSDHQPYFNRILIANRGEIALRVIRACHALGIETVAVYSQADKDAIYLRHADHAICIGRAQAAESYLDESRILAAAEVADVDAIHPGYGFLAENAHFANLCQDCNIAFIGPEPEAMTQMGDKDSARRLAKSHNVPVLPGSEGLIETEEEALKIAEEIGYPVIVKATAGGGGRGMRVAHNAISLANGFMAATSEAQAAFGNGGVYIEKYVEKPRHIEIQVMADRSGKVVHLGERDCTVQRRHQKLIEESPSPVVSDDLRRRMGEAALALTKAVNYHTVGTVEFIVDEGLNFYFLEMNTRIQVEHPVTEAVTGIDIIKEQIRLAKGLDLRFSQDDVTFQGHALECRVNAEDPDRGFAPSPGKIGVYWRPARDGLRIDSHAYGGYTVPPYYDSLVSKVIVHRPTRDEAIDHMLLALDEYIIEGIKTSIPLHRQILHSAEFRNGDISTHFLEELLGS